MPGVQWNLHASIEPEAAVTYLDEQRRENSLLSELVILIDVDRVPRQQSLHESIHSVSLAAGPAHRQLGVQIRMHAGNCLLAYLLCLT